MPPTCPEPPATARVIVALDGMGGNAALALAQTLQPLGVTFKLGLERLYADGFQTLDTLQAMGCRVFVDVKLHDIPTTVGQATRALVTRGVTLLNVHTLGGVAMMQAAAQAAHAAFEEFSRQNSEATPPIVLGVTILTSTTQAVLNDELGIPHSTGDTVMHLARLAQQAGLGGVVCSPHEAQTIRAALGRGFRIVTPGVRPKNWQTADDQRRVLTPGEAIAAGADDLVVGRPITQAADPLAATQAIIAEITAALAAQDTQGTANPC